MGSVASPRQPIRVIENANIILSDGIVLSALIWLPANATAILVPAILEYLPYRKRDGTAAQDALNHPYVAAHGYACVRVDMRGTGDSEGILRGEYLKQEQDDALEILKWIGTQAWCTGSIGMIGISWGGFNGLQVAARGPPELKAVISLCSTDDRYDNDIHYMGGCLLLENFSWGATMFAINGTPPDPALVGDKWRDLWLQRLESGGLYVEEWHKNQRRNQFWKHASVCEDYSAIQCPVYLVGGWLDPYKNSIFRMLEHFQCPKKGLVGPWAHKHPNFAKPGPQIGFLQESLRWWDKWLKGIETGIMEEPMLRCYIQDTVSPQTHTDFRPGHWVGESSWPSDGIVPSTLGFAAGRLTDEIATTDEKLSIRSPHTVGLAAGRWIAYGEGTDAPSDQRSEAGGSLIFDSQKLERFIDILGAPVLRLRVASDQTTAFVAAVLSEVLPDGSVTKLSYGLLNLTHRENHADIEPLVPGNFYDIELALNHCGQRVSKESRLRLALSSSYFPITWPSPETVELTIDCASSSLAMPTRPAGPLDSGLKAFEPAVNGKPLNRKIIRQGKAGHKITQCIGTGEVTINEAYDDGLQENEENGWRFGEQESTSYSVLPNDPLSVRALQSFRKEFGRDELELVIQGMVKVEPTKTELLFTTHMEALEGGKRIFERDYAFSVLRDHV